MPRGLLMVVAARILRRSFSLALTLLLSGFLGAAMLRFGPGADVDERDLDSRYSAETRARIHRETAGELNLGSFYLHYLRRAAHGDLGFSRSFAVPVSSLIASRAFVTVRLIALGLALAWIAGLGLAALAVIWRSVPLTVLSESLSGAASSLPAAVFALLVFLANGPVAAVIGIALFPRVFRVSRDLFRSALERPQLLAARARGIGAVWIFTRYIARPAWAPLVALAGVCVSLAFGAAIPVEVICDVPGLGQLAWKAAMGRDLPLLVGLTLMVTATTLLANAAADLVLESSAA